MDSKFYVYAYLRLDGTPYYIGKGKDKRAWQKRKDERINKPTDKDRIIIVERNLTEIGALAIERRLIRWYGRKCVGTGILQNITEGGDGISGYKHTEETKKKLSVVHTGKKIPKNIGRVPWNKGKTGIQSHTEDTKKRMSISHTGLSIPKSDEHKRRLSESLRGRVPWNKGLKLKNE